MRKQSLLWSILILGLLSLSPVLSWAQSGSAIQGRVVNGTAGGGSTEGLDVTLRLFHGQSEVESLVTITNARGQFRFNGVETNGDWHYVVQATYQDVVYSKGPLSLSPDESEIAVEVPVYETTTDDEGIAVDRAHILIDVTDSTAGDVDSLLVAELYVFSNPGDRTFIGAEEAQGRRNTSRFFFPKGSYALAFNDGSLGERFLAIDGGFVDTEPLWPGRTAVMFRYALDCRAGDCDLTRTVTHPISNLNVLIADDGAQVESGQLAFDGRVSTEEGGHYLSYAGYGLIPGEQLDLHIRPSQGSSIPAASSQRDSTAWSWVILGGVMTVLVLGYPFWRHQVQASAQTGASVPRRQP